MATTLRSLLPTAIGSLAVLGIALTLRTASATGELAPPPEAGSGIHTMSAPAGGGPGEGTGRRVPAPPGAPWSTSLNVPPNIPPSISPNDPQDNPAGRPTGAPSRGGEAGACDGGALRRPAVPAEGAGAPDGMSPLLAALLRMLVQPPGCSPPPR